MRDNEIDKQAPAGMEKSIEMITPLKPPLTIKMLQVGISKAMDSRLKSIQYSRFLEND